MNDNEVLILLEKYSKGLCTEEEAAAIEAWYNAHASKQDQQPIDDLEQEVSLIWGNILQNQTQLKPRRKNHVRWLAIAATIAIILVAGKLFYTGNTKKQATSSLAQTSVIKPGKQGATLTLANGKKIYLPDASKGQLAVEHGVAIFKTADGRLVYEIKNQSAATNEMNTIATAKGETYELRLPDGTQVWLNAASSLTYAGSLYQHGIRTVKLSGEAYFEVAKDKKHPFIVETNGQKVEVLGTHFNVNAYQDELVTKTTLLEGAVRLNHATVLKPNEEASLYPSGKIAVQQVDVNEAIAWKNGKFIFNTEDITSVMRKLSRWYNVEVVYKKEEFPTATFTGIISRYDDISKILDKINYTEKVHLTVAGRRIIVMP